MAKRQFALTEQEVNALKRAVNETNDVREVKRLQAVRLYGESYPTQEIEDMVDCSWRSLMDWCQRYRQEGLAGLKSKWQGQNAARLSRAQREDLKEKLHQYRPEQVIAPEMRISTGEF
jgi:transposase